MALFAFMEVGPLLFSQKSQYDVFDLREWDKWSDISNVITGGVRHRLW